ncbi:hypothetical protein H4582DRAFT_1818194 [Lactarius indigo]|nr:hypothetical protein H4582DRAFT_1818194 [Lactarius indigo]
MALLGETHFVPMSPDSWCHLPREGGVSYAAQYEEQDNILFGAPYDEERYNKVIYQCGLQRDLSLFDAGDKTEVGEKGLTLSGGQKARVTLARAVYSSSQILILNDVSAFLRYSPASNYHQCHSCKGSSRSGCPHCMVDR